MLVLALLSVSSCGDRTDLSRTWSGRVATRVVSLAPSHTELLFALGAEAQVIGVTSMCDRPPEALTRPRVGDMRQFSLESIAVLKPDLIVMNSIATAEAMAPLQGRVELLLVPTDTLSDLLAAVTTIGAAVGRDAEASELRASLERHVAETRARNANREPTRVLVVVQRDPYFVAGKGSYIDELLEVLGYENAAGGIADPWPNISAEALLALAPDALVDAATENPAEDPEAYWSRFAPMPAVRDGRVRRLIDDAAVRPGPGLAEALSTLEASIAPPSGEPNR